MMGRTHATSGAVLALAVLPAVHAAGMPVSPASVVTYTVAAAAGALLPDFDHRHATIAHSLGPVSKAIAIGIENVSGGHRNGTHSLLGVAVFTGVAALMNNVAFVLQFAGVAAGRAETAGHIVMGVWLAFLFAVATTALRVKPPSSDVAWSLLCLAGGVALAAGNWLLDAPTSILPVAICIGATAHLLGDMLTKEGVPLLYPVSKYRFHIMSLTTDHFAERVIIGPLLGLIAVVQVLNVSGMMPFTLRQAWQWIVAAIAGK